MSTVARLKLKKINGMAEKKNQKHVSETYSGFCCMDTIFYFCFPLNKY